MNIELLKENIIIQHFKNQEVFTNKDAYDFYKTKGQNLSKNTINSKIYQLIQAGLLNRVGRGKFKIGASNTFKPPLSTKTISRAHHVQQHFPLIDYCVWNSAIIKEFSLHQSYSNFTIVEVEKDAMEAVFYHLKEKYNQVYLKPKREMVETYLLELNNPTIVQHLVSEAPIQKKKDVPTTTLEKLLVDLVQLKNVFYFYQGYELQNIFHQAFEKYSINKSTLLRYANRRKKKQDIIQLLESIHRH